MEEALDGMEEMAMVTITAEIAVGWWVDSTKMRTHIQAGETYLTVAVNDGVARDIEDTTDLGQAHR